MQQSSPRAITYLSLAAILCVGPLNFLLFRILYDSFGKDYAFFVSQGVNLIYVVVGGLALYPKMYRFNIHRFRFECDYSEITLAMRQLPQRRFVRMAILDCLGTFLAAMGAVGTPGQIQTLLNQSLIPITMAASFIFLGAKYSLSQYAGAGTILVGALISILPSLIQSESSNAFSLLLYFSSNIPMALSAVYKELNFTNDPVNVLYLTQWVSIYQFLFGFVLAPLQLIPGIGTARGMTVSETIWSFVGGWQCFQQMAIVGCAGKPTFFLLWAYTSCNFFFNTLGLIITKHHSSSLSSISYSILLPFSCLSNGLSILGKYREEIYPQTIIGLIVVLAGFIAYEKEGISEAIKYCSTKIYAPTMVTDTTHNYGSIPEPIKLAGEEKESGERRKQPSYQERLVLVELPIKRSESKEEIVANKPQFI